MDRVGENVILRAGELRMQGKYWSSQMGDGFYVGSERAVGVINRNAIENQELVVWDSGI